MSTRQIKANELFPQLLSPLIACGVAVIGADQNGCPPFNDKYARLWDKINQGGNASDVLGKGYNSCCIPCPERPSPTLPKTQTGRGFATIAHWSEKRALSIGEAKRIASYPDEWKTIGDYSTQWARIGNSVPPLFMSAIARSIKEKMFDKDYDGKVSSMKKKYVDILNDAWQDHLRPREPGAPTVISTFAGCGGSSLGYSIAGYKELLAIEWDDNAVETFRLNFPDVPVYHGDIAKLSVEECMKLANIKEGELDVLDGSPPCQGLSTAGKRKFSDERNQLFREYVRLLRGLKPKVFVMENVSGMVKGVMKLIFAEVVRELKASGYDVSARLMNAMYFNVPQSRERMIFIGVRDEFKGIKTYHPTSAGNPVTVRSAIYDLSHEQSDIAFNPNTRTALIMKALPPGKCDPKHHSHVKLSYDRPANTLLKDFLGYFHFWHPEQWRPLTLKEWARIGSYHEGFLWTDKKNGCQRIGNSVPPLFMKSIAEHIKANILDKINGHREQGDPQPHHVGDKVETHETRNETAVIAA